MIIRATMPLTRYKKPDTTLMVVEIPRADATKARKAKPQNTSQAFL